MLGLVGVLPLDGARESETETVFALDASQPSLLRREGGGGLGTGLRVRLRVRVRVPTPWAPRRARECLAQAETCSAYEARQARAAAASAAAWSVASAVPS